MKDKTMSPEQAVRRFVHDNDHISLGGFTIIRNPMGLAREIIRQGIKGLHVYVHSHGHAFDMLIGAGCVEAVEVAYGGLARFTPAGAIRFRKAIEGGIIRFEDYTNHQMVMRFMAGALGVPFLPLKGTADTDIVKKWGFDEVYRRRRPRLPDKKLAVIENPFTKAGEKEEIIIVPAIHPDVTLLHVQKADAEGTCRIEGLSFADVEQAKASKAVIVSCEEIVPRETMREDPDRNNLPFFIVDAVVHMPYGSHPTACRGYYDYDDDHLKHYGEVSDDDDSFREYLEQYVTGPSSHENYLERIGKDSLDALRADPKLGYRPRSAATE